MPSKATLEAALASFTSSLSTKQSSTSRSSELVELDSWYRGELRSTLAQRKAEKEGELSLEKAELEKLMQWKLAHGKWRPRLETLISGNSSSSILSATSVSASAFPLSSSTEAKKLLNKLCELKGVGPATASAILAAYDPENEPFMSDQALEFAHSRTDDHEKPAKRDYTVKAWEVYRKVMQERKEEEGWETVEKLEMALWSWGIEREFGSGEADDVVEEKDEGTKDENLGTKGKRKSVEGQAETKPQKQKKRKTKS